MGARRSVSRADGLDINQMALAGSVLEQDFLQRHARVWARRQQS